MMPSNMTSGYKHTATLRCLNCDGEGNLQGQKCRACMGSRTRLVGCGSEAEMDSNYFTAYCRGCAKFVPVEEVG